MLTAQDSKKLSDHGSATQMEALIGEISSQLQTGFASGDKYVNCTLSQFPKNLSAFMNAMYEKGFWCSYPCPLYQESDNEYYTYEYDLVGYSMTVWNTRPGFFETMGIWKSYFGSYNAPKSYSVFYE